MTEPSKPKKRTTFYLEPNLLLKFKEICIREHVSMTNKVEDWIRQYVQLHLPGNPQLLMTHYVKLDEPSPMRVLCLYCQGALSSGEVFCQKAGHVDPRHSLLQLQIQQTEKEAERLY